MNYTRRINYYETDRMGITHHSNYIRYAEEARVSLMDKIGLPYSSVENEKIIIPVLGIKCDYKHSTTFDDIINIDIKVKSWNGVRITFEYTITKNDGKDLVALIETSHCFTDQNLRPINLKKIKPEWNEIITKCMEN